jgi:excisionase family DNA binding protein
MSDNNDFPKMYTPSQTGALFNVDPRTVGRWIKTGRLKAVKTPGGTNRIPEHAIDAISNGVCRKCSTLRFDDGTCRCG